jgi:hypothetical protein
MIRIAKGMNRNRLFGRPKVRPGAEPEEEVGDRTPVAMT